MDKSPDAFRTISEVADALETPAHVLRFWESRFPQIKPVKRAGGRRYYRPADVALLGGIRHLLHHEGMTIRGVQKILREQGVRHVAAMAPGSDMAAFDAADEEDDLMLDLTVSGEQPVVGGQILAMEPGARRITTMPDVPAEVVQLHGTAAPVLADISEGFLLPTANRRPLPTLDEPVDDGVPEAGHVWIEDHGDTSSEMVDFPVEAAVRSLIDLDEPDDQLSVEALARDLDAEEDRTDDLVPEALGLDGYMNGQIATEESPELSDAYAVAAALGLAGIASRLRALPRPLLPEAVQPLTALQMRLGLLQAQMIEAARTRR